MDNQSLNQDEVELLLHGTGTTDDDCLANDDGANDSVAHDGVASDSVASDSVATGNVPAVRVPTDVGATTAGGEELAAELSGASLSRLEQLQRGFATEWGRALERRMRTPVQVRLADCAVCEYGEYVLSLERPTTFQSLRAEPLSQVVALEIPPCVIFPMIDRLLGGGLRNDPIMRRPLTEIELRLLRRVTDWLMQSMTSSWGHWLPLAMSVESVDCNPRFVRCFPPSTRLVVCHFDVDMRFASGPMRMAFACDSIAEMEELTRTAGRLARSPDSRAAHGNYKVFDDHAELAVVVAELTCSMTQLDGLKVGDLIQTETPAAARVQVRVDDETVYLARPGQYHGKTAFRIEQRVLDESG